MTAVPNTFHKGKHCFFRHSGGLAGFHQLCRIFVRFPQLSSSVKDSLVDRKSSRNPVSRFQCDSKSISSAELWATLSVSITKSYPPQQCRTLVYFFLMKATLAIKQFRCFKLGQTRKFNEQNPPVMIYQRVLDVRREFGPNSATMLLPMQCKQIHIPSLVINQI
jgi:hypothetical protein